MSRPLTIEHLEGRNLLSSFGVAAMPQRIIVEDATDVEWEMTAFHARHAAYTESYDADGNRTWTK